MSSLPTPRVQTPAFEALVAIAAFIEPHEKSWRSAWARVLSDECSSDTSEALQRECARLSQLIDGQFEAIARATGNATSTLRSVYSPRNCFGVPFGDITTSPSEFLRSVAKYRSFNTFYWAAKAREDERDRLMALALERVGPLASAQDAAREIVRGGVPTVHASSCISRGSRATELEAALCDAGILEIYDSGAARAWNRSSDTVPRCLSARCSFAFTIDDGAGNLTITFWPAGRARNHCRQEMLRQAPMRLTSVSQQPESLELSSDDESITDMPSQRS